MKSIRCVMTLFMIIVCYGFTEAQVSIRKKQNNHVLQREYKFDSLNNFGYDKYGIILKEFEIVNNEFKTKEEGAATMKTLYNQFIGQRMLMLPKTEQFMTRLANDEYAILRGKYFTIVDIKYDFEDSYLRSTKKLKDRIYTLQGDDNKKVKWIVPAYKSEDDAIIIGYYEKLKALYIDSVFVYNGKAVGGGSQFITPKLTHNSIDARTNEIVVLDIGDRWICSDFQIVDDGITLQLYAVFNNDKGNEILARLKNRFKTNGEIDITFFSCFVKESEFESRRKMLVDKYGETNAELICHQQVVIGMTKEMCLESWDTPKDINKTVVDGIAIEEWIYPQEAHLYFIDGVLTKAHKEY